MQSGLEWVGQEGCNHRHCGQGQLSWDSPIQVVYLHAFSHHTCDIIQIRDLMI